MAKTEAEKVKSPQIEDLPEDLQAFPFAITGSPIISTPYHDRDAINQRLLAVQSDDFAEREGLKTDPEHEAITLNELEREKLTLVAQILHHPKLTELIRQGKITVALIKPHVHKGRSDASDVEITNQILRTEIKPPLKVIFALPVHMTPKDVILFYKSIHSTLSQKPDPETSGKSSIWYRHATYMTSGAVTMALLYSPAGNAIDEWRSQLGPTNPEKDPKHETIRGKFAFDIRVNVGHGSNGDTPEEKEEAVLFEVDWMREKVDKMLQEHGESDKYMTETVLRNCGVLEEDEVFLAVEKFMPKQKISTIGCSFTAYIVSVISKSGKPEHRRLMVKSFDNPNLKEDETNEQLALAERVRTTLFNHLTQRLTPKKYTKTYLIRVPKKYGEVTRDSGRNPAIVREYVYSNNEMVLNLASNISINAERRGEMLDGLIFAAAMLDVAGIKSRNLIENFLYDGKTWVYIGGSSVEIQSPQAKEVTTGLADLLAWFANDQELSKEMRYRYEKHYRRIKSRKEFVDRTR